MVLENFKLLGNFLCSLCSNFCHLVNFPLPAPLRKSEVCFTNTLTLIGRDLLALLCRQHYQHIEGFKLRFSKPNYVWFILLFFWVGIKSLLIGTTDELFQTVKNYPGNYGFAMWLFMALYPCKPITFSKFLKSIYNVFITLIGTQCVSVPKSYRTKDFP